MKLAHAPIKETPHYRADAVRSGLRKLGYSLVESPDQCDLLVIWNRYGWRDHCATECERRGGKVIVMENGYLGNEFCGDRWYAASVSHHNGAGSWKHLGNERWDRLSYPLLPWRNADGEVVVLPQRGIGPSGVAMPPSWLQTITAKLKKMGVKHRVRHHPGQQEIQTPVEVDVAHARCVVTWGSGAAIKAIAHGTPAFHCFQNWIGAQASAPFDSFPNVRTSDEDRLSMFRRLAWAMWRVSEIESGFAFNTLLGD